MAERFGVVVAIGLTFFGLMMIAAQDIGFQFGNTTPDSMVLASQNFGEVGGATTDIRTVNFGTFNIGEGRGQIQAYQSDQETLENSLFSGNTVTVLYNGTQPTAGNVSFEVLGKEGSGALWVKVDGEKIFENQLVSTATENIEIPGNQLSPGMNEIEIGVNKGGILGSTEYSLEDLEVTINDRKFNDHVDNFQMYQYELRNFMEANLTFNIPADSSVITSPLEVEVNDNEVFSRESVRSTQQVSLSREDLGPGYNPIEFKTDADAKYTLENTQLTVRYVGTTRSTDKNVTLYMNETQENYVNRENTREQLSFDYQQLSGSKTLEIFLGLFNTTLSPVKGQNQVQVPEGSFDSDDELRISGQGSFVLDNVKLTSRLVEDQ